MDFLQLSGIYKKDTNGFSLGPVDLVQERGRHMAIAGETGSGKSTLLKVIAGLVQPAAGSVMFEGVKVKGPDEQLIPGHPGIAYLSQHFELPNFLRVEQVLEYANHLAEEEAGEIYNICRITHLFRRRTDQLSGGEKQRIAIARLLIGSPKLLLLDEPYSNLDLIHQDILKAVIHDIGSRLNITCIMVSHTASDMLAWAASIVVIRNGLIVQQDTPKGIYYRPADTYVAGLFGHYNLLTPELAQLLTGIKADDSIMIRPEHIQLSPAATDQESAAIVTDVAFYGSDCELTLSWQGISLLARAAAGLVQRGDRFAVSVQPDHAWPIS
ncbi:ABC transporter ATP-binding protein [Sediminibacterium ginsengisoli]|uniref:Iron(III) transport system ATP-binding protein n=1 Tax=Sediminibacterium ginsengisoli TaxID=413434 RepID=A0A1T4RCN3_9BACT|nr:ABC transporter ATP-binding protein [Sediminibacterium ginsengisoli]SKA13735.1 iron(III) transport system ATP-binding protein [Sediminibacterium ginsengisoli]